MVTEICFGGPDCVPSWEAVASFGSFLGGVFAVITAVVAAIGAKQAYKAYQLSKQAHVLENTKFWTEKIDKQLNVELKNSKNTKVSMREYINRKISFLTELLFFPYELRDDYYQPDRPELLALNFEDRELIAYIQYLVITIELVENKHIDKNIVLRLYGDHIRSFQLLFKELMKQNDNKLNLDYLGYKRLSEYQDDVLDNIYCSVDQLYDDYYRD